MLDPNQNPDPKNRNFWKKELQKNSKEYARWPLGFQKDVNRWRTKSSTNCRVFLTIREFNEIRERKRMSKARWMSDVKEIRALIAKSEAERCNPELHPRNIVEIRGLLSDPLLEAHGPIREIVPIQNELAGLLRRVSRKLNRDNVTSVSANLAGLWEVSRVHISLVGTLIKMSDRINDEKLAAVARELFINWFSNASDHMATLKRPLSRLAGFERAFYNDTGARRKRAVRRRARS